MVQYLTWPAGVTQTLAPKALDLGRVRWDGSCLGQVVFPY